MKSNVLTLVHCRQEVVKSADVAQLVEHSLGKGEVTGSNPVISSRISALILRAKAVFRGSNSVVESQPSKLLVAGSIPVSRSKIETVVVSRG